VRYQLANIKVANIVTVLRVTVSPIEHIWNEIDRCLRKLPGQITSKDDLWKKVGDIWEDIDINTCIKLIEIMPEHIRDIIKTKGRYTRW
jgi:hypothetical protein